MDDKEVAMAIATLNERVKELTRRITNVEDWKEKIQPKILMFFIVGMGVASALAAIARQLSI